MTKIKIHRESGNSSGGGGENKELFPFFYVTQFEKEVGTVSTLFLSADVCHGEGAGKGRGG